MFNILKVLTDAQGTGKKFNMAYGEYGAPNPVHIAEVRGTEVCIGYDQDLVWIDIHIIKQCDPIITDFTDTHTLWDEKEDPFPPIQVTEHGLAVCRLCGEYEQGLVEVKCNYVPRMQQYSVWIDLPGELILHHTDLFGIEHDPKGGAYYRYLTAIRSPDISVKEYDDYYGDGPWMSNGGGFDKFSISVREDHLVATLKHLCDLFDGSAQLVEVMS